MLEERDEAVRKVTDQMEAELTLLGATGVEDLLQEGVQETLESLRVAGIKVSQRKEDQLWEQKRGWRLRSGKERGYHGGERGEAWGQGHGS